MDKEEEKARRKAALKESTATRSAGGADKEKEAEKARRKAALAAAAAPAPTAKLQNDKAFDAEKEKEKAARKSALYGSSEATGLHVQEEVSAALRHQAAQLAVPELQEDNDEKQKAKEVARKNQAGGAAKPGAYAATSVGIPVVENSAGNAKASATSVGIPVEDSAATTGDEKALKDSSRASASALTNSAAVEELEEKSRDILEHYAVSPDQNRSEEARSKAAAQTRVGAYACAPDTEASPEAEGPPPRVPDRVPHVTVAQDSSGLVEAKAVADDEEVGEITLGVPARDEEALKRERTQKFNSWSLRVGVVFLIVIIAIVVAVVVTSVSKDATKDTKPNQALVPTLSPTPAPTPLLVDLPDFTLEALEDPESPQSKAYLWLQEDPVLADYSAARRMQRMALVTLYYATNGEDWTINDSWLDYETEECDWYGKHALEENTQAGIGDFVLGGLVDIGGACDEEGNYLQIVLTANNLAGTLPKETALLSKLERMDINLNSGMRGTLPTEMGMITSLKELSLGNSEMNGPLPSEIGAMTNLETLFFDTLSLSGTIPAELARLQKLEGLVIRHTQMSGRLPSGLFSMASLQYLALAASNFSGELPSDIGLLTKLTSLLLQRNELTGTIPTEVGKLAQMQSFILSYNSFRGTIPSEVGQLTNLVLFAAGNRNITGRIPDEIWSFPFLVAIDVAESQVSGTIPTEIGLFRGNFLLFQETSMNGTIPTEIGLANTTQVIEIHDSSFMGVLPTEIAALTNLIALHLNGTQLTGEIPDILCQTPSLRFECPELCGCDCSCLDNATQLKV